MVELKTLKNKIDWAYANLAAYRIALEQEPSKYIKECWMARSKLFKGLTDGTMSVSSMYKNEKSKLKTSNLCSYCGKKSSKLTLDHLIPKIAGGSDSGDNLVYACQICNSSKNKKDYFEWCTKTDRKINPEIAERSLKLLYKYAEKNDLLDVDLKDLKAASLPFKIDFIPHEFNL